MAGENPQTTMPPVPREPLIDSRTGRMSTQWERWIQQVQRILSFAGGIAWGIVNKAGSRLSDIETRTHAMLQSVLGTGDRHITASENAEITALDALAAGIVVKVGNAAYTVRSVQGTANEIVLSFGDGQSGNPTVSLPLRIAGPRRIGAESDYTEFEADGTPVFTGNATNWDDINISLVPSVTGAAAPAIIAVNGDSALKCYAFAGTGIAADQLSSSLEILHGYKEGTDITPHVHWAPTTADVADVKFHCRYMWVERDGVFSGATTTTVTVTTPGVAWKEMRTNLPAISGAGKHIGSRFVFTLFRDPADVADTYAQQVAVHDFGVHFERDTIGSRQIIAK